MRREQFKKNRLMSNSKPDTKMAGRKLAWKPLWECVSVGDSAPPFIATNWMHLLVAIRQMRICVRPPLTYWIVIDDVQASDSHFIQRREMKSKLLRGGKIRLSPNLIGLSICQLHWIACQMRFRDRACITFLGIRLQECFSKAQNISVALCLFSLRRIQRQWQGQWPLESESVEVTLYSQQHLKGIVHLKNVCLFTCFKCRLTKWFELFNVKKNKNKGCTQFLHLVPTWID